MTIPNNNISTCYKLRDPDVTANITAKQGLLTKLHINQKKSRGSKRQ